MVGSWVNDAGWLTSLAHHRWHCDTILSFRRSVQLLSDPQLSSLPTPLAPEKCIDSPSRAGDSLRRWWMSPSGLEPTRKAQLGCALSCLDLFSVHVMHDDAWWCMMLCSLGTGNSHVLRRSSPRSVLDGLGTYQFSVFQGVDNDDGVTPVRHEKKIQPII